MTSTEAPTRVGILLFERFSNHCLANAVEPLRAANGLVGRRVYEWTFLTLDGRAVTSSSGLPVTPEAPLAEARGDVLFVMPSYDARGFAAAARTGQALRAAARRYATLIGMDTGSWLLAAAGLLNGQRATIHWEDFEAFEEAFPEVRAERRRLIMDGPIWSCGGAMTAFELVLRMIAARHGEAVRLEVAALFMQGGAESAAGPARPRARSQVVADCVSIMRARMEERIGMAELAAGAGLSQRSLEQRFRRELGAPPRTVYKRIRLIAARRLVEQGDLSVAEIALRCGYADPGAMTRAFVQEFGQTPRQMRAAGEG